MKNARRHICILWRLVSWTLFLYYAGAAISDFLKRETITDVELSPSNQPSISICVTIEQLYMFAVATKNQSGLDVSSISEEDPASSLELISVLRYLFPIVYMQGVAYPFFYDYFKRDFHLFNYNQCKL